MKKALFLFLMAWTAFSCKPPAVIHTAEVAYVDNPNPGLITLDATGYGNSDSEAILNMYKTAFNTIFFQGIPSFTALRTPMVPNESKAKSEHSGYFTKFYSENRYTKFITNLGGNMQPQKSSGKQRFLRHTFTINYEALRLDLEQNNVIRKFGY